jgi:ABC-type Fe3+-hydroxamate transport system substrate-binding protein
LYYTDQIGRTIHVTEFPKRIVSLVPSQTELLHSLGLEEEIVGITKFCVRPEIWFRNKTRVGGTKTIDIEKVKQLKPDLIIANKEENVKEQIELLESFAPVWVSDVKNLEDALKMIENVGRIVGRLQESIALAGLIKHDFNELETELGQRSDYRPAAYLIWKDPYMTVGGDTFINDMLQRCRLKNIVSNRSRYPEVTLEELRTAGCKLVLLSSEPYPFKERNIQEIHAAIPGAKVFLVDGEMFSWYGSRLVNAPDYFKKVLENLSH